MAKVCFFLVFMDRDGVEVHKHAKKGTRPISSHCDPNSLSTSVGKFLGYLEIFILFFYAA